MNDFEGDKNDYKINPEFKWLQCNSINEGVTIAQLSYVLFVFSLLDCWLVLTVKRYGNLCDY